MTSTTGTPAAVRVYWRPGCPFCAMLRLGLRGTRIHAEWVNVWEDRAAAARVRAITGGHETVPTVTIGTQALVNPSARHVIAAVRAGQSPIRLAEGGQPASWPVRTARFLTRRWLRRGRPVDEPRGTRSG